MRISRILIARCCASILVAGGLTILSGWVFDIPFLRGGFSAGITVKTNAALCLLALGLAMWLIPGDAKSNRQSQLARALAVFAGIVGLLTLSQHVFGWNLGIDELLFREPPGMPGTASPNRMGPPASSCFCLMGIGILFATSKRRALCEIAQLLAVAVALVATFSLLGYIYGVTQMYGIAKYTGISWPTAVMFHVASLGLICGCPESSFRTLANAGTAGGILLRRMLLPAILTPIVLGYLTIVGQRASAYDPFFGIALLVIGLLSIFTLLVWLSGRALHKVDLARSQAEDARRDTLDLLRRAAELDAFRVALADSIRTLNDPEQIQAQATRLLFDRLKATRVHYTEFTSDQAYAVVRTDFHDPQVPSVVGRYSLAEYGPTLINELLAGKTLAISDTVLDPRITRRERDKLGEINIRAYIAVPMVKSGMLLAAIAVHQSSSRVWTDEEISLVEETAERTWAAVERARSEAALRQSEERLQRALAIETVGVMFFKPDGRITDANEAFLRMSGYTRTDVAQESIRWDVMTPHEFMEESRKAIEELKVHGRTVPYEKQYIRKDGTRWWGLFAATRLSDDEGVEFVIDITERKEVEQALQESDRRKDEFLATLAHELRNPLAPISNALTILRMDQEITPTVDHLYGIMERQVTSLVRLVDDLLEISRISRGKIELRKERCTIADVVRSAVETSRPVIDAAKHQLAISLPVEPIWLELDPVRMAQVISNLLNNAAKFTPPNGQIWLTVQKQSNEVILSVRDNGIGLEQAMLPRVFEMFTQMDRDHKEAQGGLGIGLALVKNLVELHGGKVEVRSKGLGEGSEFMIHLPFAASDISTRGSDVSPLPHRPASRMRILVVDDNPDAANSLTLLLEKMGYNVYFANDGWAALESLQRDRPDLVLLDLGMPKMSGYEVAARIREMSEFKDVPLIALTGWGQEEDRRRTADAGFDHHLVKPLDLSALNSILSSFSKRVNY
jgi:PAS domain S-box-containing protein